LTAYFTGDERRRLAAMVDALLPGAAELGAVDYVETLLTALDHDPPRVWSGLDGWLPLGAWERAAWTQRIEGWRALYSRVLAGTGDADDERVVYEHACEACYGDPVYGGNRNAAGWQRIAFPRPIFPPRHGEPAH
jgi:hypothetical protein